MNISNSYLVENLGLRCVNPKKFEELLNQNFDGALSVPIRHIPIIYGLLLASLEKDAEVDKALVEGLRESVEEVCLMYIISEYNRYFNYLKLGINRDNSLNYIYEE